MTGDDYNDNPRLMLSLRGGVATDRMIAIVTPIVVAPNVEVIVSALVLATVSTLSCG